MATRFLLRSLLFSGANKTLASTVSRSYATLPLSTSSLLRLRPLLVVAANSLRPSSLVAASVREFSTRQTTSSLNDSSPNWSNRPPKETILLDGCDFNHWLVVVEKPEGEPTRDEIIDSYINTLAKIVGSYDEARMKIYSVSTRCYYAFGALVSEEESYKIKELPGVRWVLPDSYLDVKNKDYGGEPFIDGKAVPYDPKYHEEWIRNNARANERNRRNDRPRNFDRSRNFERRRENMQNSGPPSGSGAMGGPPNNMGGPPNAGAPPRNTGGPPAPNMGGVPAPNMGGMQQGGGMGGMQQGGGMGGMQQGGGMGGMQQGGGRGGPPNVGGQPNNWHGPPPNNMGGMPNNAPSYQQQQQRYGPNSGGMPYQSGPGPNSGGTPYQSGPGPNSGGTPYQSGPGPNNYAANIGGGGSPYSSQDTPGRDMDMPPPPNYQ